jgi:acetyltransferase-like isoleucine patch superfamily enzyme
MLIKKIKIPFMAIATIGILPSFLKKLIYRAKGYKIGKNVSIGIGSVVIGRMVSIEDNVKIGIATIIRAREISIERYAVIGSFTVIDTGKLRIGEDARINEQVIVGGMQTPESRLDLGKRTIIMEYSFINTTMPITIGDDTGIGGHCLLFTHGSWLNQLEGFPVAFAPITLGNSVWLPWRVFIMPGVTIGDKVVVGANSMISKDVSANCLVAGSPAKVIKENYPPSLSDEQVEVIFRRFIEDFLKHLKYHGVIVSLEDTSSEIRISGTHNSKPFKMIIYNNSINQLLNDNVDKLIVINVSNSQQVIPTILRSNTMVLDIYNKKRYGQSNVGEEFVKFLSRYGLRFARID